MWLDFPHRGEYLMPIQVTPRRRLAVQVAEAAAKRNRLAEVEMVRRVTWRRVEGSRSHTTEDRQRRREYGQYWTRNNCTRCAPVTRLIHVLTHWWRISSSRWLDSVHESFVSGSRTSAARTRSERYSSNSCSNSITIRSVRRRFSARIQIVAKNRNALELHRSWTWPRSGIEVIAKAALQVQKDYLRVWRKWEMLSFGKKGCVIWRLQKFLNAFTFASDKIVNQWTDVKCWKKFIYIGLYKPVFPSYCYCVIPLCLCLTSVYFFLIYYISVCIVYSLCCFIRNKPMMMMITSRRRCFSCACSMLYLI